MPAPNENQEGMARVLRLALIIAAVLLISYVPVTGLARAIERHGELDPTPKPWPLGPGGVGEPLCPH